MSWEARAHLQIRCLENDIYFLPQLFSEPRIIPIAMNPNSNNGPSIISQTQQLTVLVLPKTKQEEHLEKRIKYFLSSKFKIQLILTAVFSVTEMLSCTKFINQCLISPLIPLFLLAHGSIKLG
jgi:hypothetical protein